jgi:hypothetical protein
MATRVKIGLRSLVPILFDRYNGLQDDNDQEAKKNAPFKVYRDDQGMVCIPIGTCLKAATREASSEIGKKTGSKQRRNSIRAGLFFFPELLPVAKEPDGIHAEPVTRKGTGNKVTRVVAYRPFLKEWAGEVEAHLYGLTPENVRQYMEVAGLKYGLCGHRPEWGRFEITSFDVIEED